MAITATTLSKLTLQPSSNMATLALGDQTRFPTIATIKTLDLPSWEYNVSLPTTDTLATLNGTETLNNKTINIVGLLTLSSAGISSIR